MENEAYIAVDLGATNLRVGIGKEKIDEKILIPTPRDPEIIAEVITKIAQRLLKSHKAKLKGIGLASIGPLDINRGVIRLAPNLPFKQEVPLVKPLKEKFKVPVKLLGDCIAAVLAEKYLGAGKKMKNLVYVTLSTGVGGGAIVDGHLLLGKDGSAAHIGHMVIDLQAKLRCGCGGYGHWEAYCSGAGIPQFTRFLAKEWEVNGGLLFKASNGFKNLNAELLFSCAKKGDEFSRKVVEEIGKLNAAGFANLINVFDPELIAVGGSIALNNPQLILQPIKRYAKAYAINRLPEIRLTPLGEDISLLGALIAARDAKSV